MGGRTADQSEHVVSFQARRREYLDDSAAGWRRIVREELRFDGLALFEKG